MTEIESLLSRSRGVCDSAVADVSGLPLHKWNDAFLAAVQALGFDIIPVARGSHLGEDDPVRAPWPFPMGGVYPYPSVIAPKGWKP